MISVAKQNDYIKQAQYAIIVREHGPVIASNLAPEPKTVHDSGVSNSDEFTNC